MSTQGPSKDAAPIALIGDIHGCSAELAELLSQIGERRVLSLGDVVDRGPDPDGCIRLLRERDALVVLGNHEEKHLRYRRHAERKANDPRYKIPMRLAPHHEETQRLVHPDNWQWLAEQAVNYLRLAGHGVLALHAGLLAKVSAEDHSQDRICRVQLTKPGSEKSPHGYLAERESGVWGAASYDVKAFAEGYRWWTEYLEGPEVAVYGHSVFRTPVASHLRDGHVVHSACTDNRVERQGLVALGIDTGATFGGALTALLLPEWAFLRVEASKVYFSSNRFE